MRFFTETDAAMLQIRLDVAITALGYEARATKVARTYFTDATRKVSIGFDQNKVLHYADNLQYFRRNKYELHLDVSEGAFERVVAGILLPDVGMFSKGKAVIGVDISSFDRYRLAVLASHLFDLVDDGTVGEVLFFYNVGRYTKPSDDFAFNTRLQPVHSSFVGTRPDPVAPTAAVVGLGYEREKAVGAAEYLEASEVFAFLPKSEVAEYLPSVEKANSLLLAQLGEQYRVEYDVANGAGLIADLSSLVRGLMSRSAVLMVPLGPKIFALACLLTAKVYPQASVWRMSQAGEGAAVDRHPTEHFSILRMRA